MIHLTANNLHKLNKTQQKYKNTTQLELNVNEVLIIVSNSIKILVISLIKRFLMTKKWKEHQREMRLNFLIIKSVEQMPPFPFTNHCLLTMTAHHDIFKNLMRYSWQWQGIYDRNNKRFAF